MRTPESGNQPATMTLVSPAPYLRFDIKQGWKHHQWEQPDKIENRYAPSSSFWSSAYRLRLPFTCGYIGGPAGLVISAGMFPICTGITQRLCWALYQTSLSAIKWMDQALWQYFTGVRMCVNSKSSWSSRFHWQQADSLAYWQIHITGALIRWIHPSWS